MRTFPIYFRILIKFGVMDWHIMLLNIYEFRENRRSEGCTFPTVVNEIAFTRVP
jgi:hypothetical protein